MLETRCVKIKLKPGSSDRLREWAAEINSRSEEALEALRDEGVIVESAFLDSSDEGDFLIYYMKAENMEKSRAVAKKSDRSIDATTKSSKRRRGSLANGWSFSLTWTELQKSRSSDPACVVAASH